jgi:hypothetical protein
MNGSTAMLPLPRMLRMAFRVEACLFVRRGCMLQLATIASKRGL